MAFLPCACGWSMRAFPIGPPVRAVARLWLPGWPPEAPVVGNVAALAEHKDHDTLLAAAARVLARRPEVRFVIVARGNGVRPWPRGPKSSAWMAA